MTFYAYIHARPEETGGSVFYVGKGRGNRYVSFRNRNQKHSEIVASVGAPNVLIGRLDCSSETVAFDLERGLIKRLRWSKVILANQTSGGQGASGFVKSEETRKKLSVAHKGRKGRPQTEEIRKKISETLSGTKRDAEFSRKISERTKGRIVSNDTRAKISASNTGKVRPKSAIEASRVKNTGSCRTAETKAKMSEARRAYWARKREENK